MTLSIRWQVTLWLAIALLISVAAIFITLRITLHSILSDAVNEDLAEHGSQIRAQLAISNLSPEDVERIVNTSSFPVVIRDENGTPLAASLGLLLRDLELEASEVDAILAGGTSQREVSLDGEDFRFRTSRIAIGTQVLGIVQVGESTEAIENVDSALRTVALIAGISGIAFALAAGYLIARRSLNPLSRVTAVAREIEASDLSRRISARREPPEVQQLADTFDAMLERLQNAFQQQRNFVLDMSHELRTPLTALRGNLDVMLMGSGYDDETLDTLQRMRAEVERLVRLTSNLLYMAHAEAGRELARRPVELDVLCLEVCQQMRYTKPDVKFALGHEDQATVMGDPDLLKQLVINLVDNGLKYTSAGGKVTLSVYRADGQAMIEVADTGRGMSPEQLANIFKRFYRASRDRSAADGAGIGLAISDWIARAHGGEIRVKSEVGSGSVFTVVLPLEAEPKTP